MTQTLEKTGKTVLIVDDEPSILDFVSLVLAQKGFNLLTAASGEEALTMCSEYQGTIDLLLSNIQMRGMTGIELGTKISLIRPHIKVLLMSGFTEGMLVLNEGWHFLPKPFIPSQLLDLVASTLKQSAAPDLNEHALGS